MTTSGLRPVLAAALFVVAMPRWPRRSLTPRLSFLEQRGTSSSKEATLPAPVPGQSLPCRHGSSPAPSCRSGSPRSRTGWRPKWSRQAEAACHAPSVLARATRAPFAPWSSPVPLWALALPAGAALEPPHTGADMNDLNHVVIAEATNSKAQRITIELIPLCPCGAVASHQLFDADGEPEPACTKCAHEVCH